MGTVVVDGSRSICIWTSSLWVSAELAAAPQIGSWLIPLALPGIAGATFFTAAAGAVIRSGGTSSSSSLFSSSSSSLPSSSSPSPRRPEAPPWLSLRFFRRWRLTTSLKRAYRRMSSAAEASLSSTFGDRRALAWAVARRIRVSSVRAVKGEVYHYNARFAVSSGK
jgi:hypothetical protein